MAGGKDGRRPSPAARRAGYVVAVLVNAALLYLVNVAPGWQAVPFLTEATEQVIGVVNLSLWAGVVANLAYLAADPRWLRALGELVTTVISLVVMVRMWQVFPFAFGDAGYWRVLFRLALGVGIFGATVGALAQLVTLARLGGPGRTIVTH